MFARFFSSLENQICLAPAEGGLVLPPPLGHFPAPGSPASLSPFRALLLGGVCILASLYRIKNKSQVLALPLEPLTDIPPNRDMKRKIDLDPSIWNAPLSAKKARLGISYHPSKGKGPKKRIWLPRRSHRVRGLLQQVMDCEEPIHHIILGYFERQRAPNHLLFERPFQIRQRIDQMKARVSDLQVELGRAKSLGRQYEGELGKYNRDHQAELFLIACLLPPLGDLGGYEPHLMRLTSFSRCAIDDVHHDLHRLRGVIYNKYPVLSDKLLGHFNWMRAAPEGGESHGPAIRYCWENDIITFEDEYLTMTSATRKHRKCHPPVVLTTADQLTLLRIKMVAVNLGKIRRQAFLNRRHVVESQILSTLSGLEDWSVPLVLALTCVHASDPPNWDLLIFL